MTTIRPEIRRPWRDRVTTIVWGGLVTATGVLTAYALNGVRIDVELAVIVALTAVGGWLLLSALFATRPRRGTTAPQETVAASSTPNDSDAANA